MHSSAVNGHQKKGFNWEFNNELKTKSNEKENKSVSNIKCVVECLSNGEAVKYEMNHSPSLRLWPESA